MFRKTLLILFAILTVGGLLFGAPGIYLRFAYGHEPANYGSIVTWGLWVASYIYFIGLSAGSFLISSLVFVFRVERFEKIGRLAILTALVTLWMALLSIGLDVGHTERAWYIYIWPNFRSPMAWMIWLYTAYLMLLFCEAYFLMRRDFYELRSVGGFRGMFCRFASYGLTTSSAESRQKDMRVVQVLASVGLPLAIMFHGGVGALFGVLASRPMWHSGLYPVLFILSAVVSGGAAITLLAYVHLRTESDRTATITSLGKLVLGVLVFETIWEIAEIGTYLYGGMPSHTMPWKIILKGPYPAVFWVGQLGFGSLIPLILLVWGLKKRLTSLIAGACLSIAMAFITVRLNMVIPAMSAEEIRGLASAVASSRLSAFYFPSWMEWQVTFFVVGVGGVLLTLGWRILPLNGPSTSSTALDPKHF